MWDRETKMPKLRFSAGESATTKTAPYRWMDESTNIQLLKMAIEIVDLPIKNCDFP